MTRTNRHKTFTTPTAENSDEDPFPLKENGIFRVTNASFNGKQITVVGGEREMPQAVPDDRSSAPSSDHIDSPSPSLRISRRRQRALVVSSRWK